MNTNQKDTQRLIRRARIILGTFLVLMGGFLVYLSSTMGDKQEHSQPTEAEPPLPVVSAADTLVQLRDKDSNLRGHGVLISNDGVLLTNKHVVEGLEEETVVTYQGQDYVIDYVGLHALNDYAMVRIYDIETDCVVIDTEVQDVETLLTTAGQEKTTYSITSRDSLMAGSISSASGELITNGMSGTPLFTKDGKIAGLIQARDELNEGTGKISFTPENIKARITKKTTALDCGRIDLSFTENQAS